MLNRLRFDLYYCQCLWYCISSIHVPKVRPIRILSRQLESRSNIYHVYLVDLIEGSASILIFHVPLGTCSLILGCRKVLPLLPRSLGIPSFLGESGILRGKGEIRYFEYANTQVPRSNQILKPPSFPEVVIGFQSACHDSVFPLYYPVILFHSTLLWYVL